MAMCEEAKVGLSAEARDSMCEEAKADYLIDNCLVKYRNMKMATG